MADDPIGQKLRYRRLAYRLEPVALLGYLLFILVSFSCTLKYSPWSITIVVTVLGVIGVVADHLVARLHNKANKIES